MSCEAIIQDIESAGLTMRAIKGNIHVQPKERITAAIRNTIAANKSAILVTLAFRGTRRLEDWHGDFAERYAICLRSGMSEETAQRDALVYTLKYALMHFAETGEIS